MPQLKKTPVSIQYRHGVTMHIYVYRQGWVDGKECDASHGYSERDELTEEQLQCKQPYLCTPHGTL